MLTGFLAAITVATILAVFAALVFQLIFATFKVEGGHPFTSNLAFFGSRSGMRNGLRDEDDDKGSNDLGEISSERSGDSDDDGNTGRKTTATPAMWANGGIAYIDGEWQLRHAPSLDGTKYSQHYK